MDRSPVPACCSSYPAAETSSLEVVGRGGNEQFGLWRVWAWVAPLVKEASELAVGHAAMGPAARGRRCRWAGARPCSYTLPSARPTLAVVVGGGSGVPRPRPRCWRPAPRGTKRHARLVVKDVIGSVALLQPDAAFMALLVAGRRYASSSFVAVMDVSATRSVYASMELGAMCAAIGPAVRGR